MIVDHDVTNDVTNDVTDLGLLSRMAKSAKQALGGDEVDVVADMGYYDGQESTNICSRPCRPGFRPNPRWP